MLTCVLLSVLLQNRIFLFSAYIISCLFKTKYCQVFRIIEIEIHIYRRKGLVEKFMPCNVPQLLLQVGLKKDHSNLSYVHLKIQSVVCKSK